MGKRFVDNLMLEFIDSATTQARKKGVPPAELVRAVNESCMTGLITLWRSLMHEELFELGAHTLIDQMAAKMHKMIELSTDDKEIAELARRCQDV